MNWSKIKNIMIYFLVGINAFLLFFMILSSYKDNVIPDSVIQASVKLMKKDGFVCEKSVIPNEYYSANILSANFYSATELSDMFFGKQVAFRTDGDTLVAENNGAKLSVRGNYFCYETAEKPVKASSLSVKHALKKLGISLSDAVYDDENGFFYKMYNGTNLFNMYIEPKLDSNGNICFLSAQWPKSLKRGKPVRTTFINKLTELPALFENGGNITNIELGYALKKMQGDKYEFVPSWRIMVNGEQKII